MGGAVVELCYKYNRMVSKEIFATYNEEVYIAKIASSLKNKAKKLRGGGDYIWS